ncbi:MAG TPA: phosphoribosyl-ATP diphosphatase [Spirochaetia bacterium]|nr:phosphoribosyl-ATP diphosphatase [Spirochaetia bacterium]
MVTDDNRVIPLVMLDGAGALIDAALINRKGLRKSLEHGSLWVLHPETGRLLPYRFRSAEKTPPLVGLIERGEFAVATLDVAAISSAGVSTEGGKSGAATGASSGAGEPPKERSTDVISRLNDLIRDRREQMPEGSYTSYLFREGGAKIRKKTGEEAVEVVLSQDNAELTRETADLIYHLLVLLAHENVAWDDVLSELEQRGR